jgi:ubiquinone/menaquinone biosynthesis C-methylase UbiE
MTNELTNTASICLNENVRPVLEKYLCGPYMLDSDGFSLVIEHNRGLDSRYTRKHDHELSDFWFNSLKNKIELVPPNTYEKALDVCAGTGLVCLNCMKHELFLQFYAIDICKSSIDRLVEKTLNEGITGVIPSVDDVFNTNFEGNFFDLVIGNSFLHHLPDNKRFLSEAFRILKPGGVLCLTHEPTIAAKRLEELLNSKILKIRGLFSGKNPSVTGSSIQLTDIWQYSYDLILKLLENRGFTEIKIMGRGRIATIVGSFIERNWTHLTGSMPPQFILNIRKYLHHIDQMLFKNAHPDTFSSFTIAARKPFKQ